jgi:hypothetical protein
MVFVSVSLPPPTLTRAPPARPLLLEKVQFVTVSMPPL